MLFYLSESLIVCDYHEKKEKILRAVKHILIGVYESKHLVYAKYNVIDFFINEITDNDAKAVLIYLRNNYSTLSYKFINRRIFIVPTDNTHKARKILNIDNIILSVDFFQDSSKIQPTTILGEDTLDSTFYHIIGKWRCKNKMHNIHLNYQNGHGGGSGITRRFKILQQQNLFCLAFSDTDKRFPEDAIKDTCDELLQTKNINNHFCEIQIINAHEIENLVPFNYIFNISSLNRNSSSQIKYIYDNAPNLLQYYDLKKGIIKSKLTNTDYRNYAQKICETNPNISNFNEHVESVNNEVYPKLGRVLKHCIKELESMEAEPDLIDYQEEEWIKIGDSFINWTCARSTEALNI